MSGKRLCFRAAVSPIGIFSEVYSVLLILGEKYIYRIPYNVLSTIRNARDIEYCPKYDRNKPLEEQKISRQALNIIAKLHYEYWCDSPEDRAKLYKILQNNERIVNERLMKCMFKRSNY